MTSKHDALVYFRMPTNDTPTLAEVIQEFGVRHGEVNPHFNGDGVMPVETRPDRTFFIQTTLEEAQRLRDGSNPNFIYAAHNGKMFSRDADGGPAATRTATPMRRRPPPRGGGFF